MSGAPVVANRICATGRHKLNTFDPFRKQSPVGFWTIAGAVCLGILAAHTIEVITAATMARASLQWAAYELEKSNKAAQADAEQRAANAERQRQQVTAEAMAAEAAAQRAAAGQEQQRQLAAAKKEAAWAKFYKRDPACDNNPSTETFTRCANEHVRAKTQFEGTYRP